MKRCANAWRVDYRGAAMCGLRVCSGGLRLESDSGQLAPQNDDWRAV